MCNFKRVIDLSTITRKTIFLFGPRQSGKSWMLKRRFPDSPYYDLLISSTFRKLLRDPQILKAELLALSDELKSMPVIIDEIQKLPVLLDEVHSLIENYGFRFILTGSSVRKLKRGNANMLGGRGIPHNLFPLTTTEIPDYDLLKIINFGSLPSVYNSSNPREDLGAYVDVYLQEEIRAEGLVRNLEPFSVFLEKAAIMNTELVNFSNISSDLGVSAKTVKEYFQILEDTLVGNLCLSYTKTVKRKAISKAKFYYFDIGVANVLSGRREITVRTELFGKCFEHMVFLEIKAFLSYSKDRRRLTFWRSCNKQEVDFIIGDDVAIEVKASAFISKKHLRGLIAISEEIKFKHKIIVCLADAPREYQDSILALPYRDFFQLLWSGKFS